MIGGIDLYICYNYGIRSLQFKIEKHAMGVQYHTVDFEGFVASNFEAYGTKFAPHEALT